MLFVQEPLSVCIGVNILVRVFFHKARIFGYVLDVFEENVKLDKGSTMQTGICDMDDSGSVLQKQTCQVYFTLGTSTFIYPFSK